MTGPVGDGGGEKNRGDGDGDRAAAGRGGDSEGGRSGRAAAQSAADEVWSAIGSGPDDRPGQLQAKAVPVQFPLVRYGEPSRTVQRLDGPQLSELRRELPEFVEAAERLGGGFAGHTGGDPPVTEGRCR